MGGVGGVGQRVGLEKGADHVAVGVGTQKVGERVLVFSMAEPEHLALVFLTFFSSFFPEEAGFQKCQGWN